MPVLNPFSGHLRATAEVRGTLEQVYAVVSEPAFISRSTPFIREVVDLGGGRWRWEITGIRYPGGTFTAALTEQMTFEPPHRIGFAHDPEGTELAGADGAFELREQDGRVRLSIEVAVHARVPAPRRAATVVEAAMHVVMAVMRDRFVRKVTEELSAPSAGGVR